MCARANFIELTPETVNIKAREVTVIPGKYVIWLQPSIGGSVAHATPLLNRVLDEGVVGAAEAFGERLVAQL